MQAITVTPARDLELREVPTPDSAPRGHLLLEVKAAAINHGDKSFLKMPSLTTGLNGSKHDIWGASAAGRVLAVGPGTSSEYLGRNVAVYRSLTPSTEITGLWSERAVVPATSCVLLQEELSTVDYSGSLVNVITAHAFLEEAMLERHAGVVVTVGGSATGLALAALAHARGIPALFLVRSGRAAQTLQALGMDHVLVTDDPDFDARFEQRAAELKTTSVFDGAGGDLITRIAPRLPRNSTIWFYGFLGGAVPIAVPSSTFMARNLTMKPFSNFNSATVRDPDRLARALLYLQDHISDPLCRTKIGRTFRLEQIAEAMAYETAPGAKAILLPAGGSGVA